MEYRIIDVLKGRMIEWDDIKIFAELIWVDDFMILKKGFWNWRDSDSDMEILAVGYIVGILGRNVLGTQKLLILLI